MTTDLPRSLSISRTPRLAFYAATEEFAEHNPRPRTRGECPQRGEDGKRRCGFVSCAMHLAIDVAPRTGTIHINVPYVDEGDDVPAIDIDAMAETCTLDVAEREDATLEEIGMSLGITRERTRQIEHKALAKITHGRGAEILRGHSDEQLAKPPRKRTAAPSEARMHEDDARPRCLTPGCSRPARMHGRPEWEGLCRRCRQRIACDEYAAKCEAKRTGESFEAIMRRVNALRAERGGDARRGKLGRL